MNSIRNITVGPHGAAAIESEADGGYIVSRWTASGKLAVSGVFARGRALEASNVFGRLSKAVR